MPNPKGLLFTINLGENTVDATYDHDTVAAAELGGTERRQRSIQFPFTALSNPGVVRNQLLVASKAAINFGGTVDS